DEQKVRNEGQAEYGHWRPKAGAELPPQQDALGAGLLRRSPSGDRVAKRNGSSARCGGHAVTHQFSAPRGTHPAGSPPSPPVSCALCPLSVSPTACAFG